MKIFESYLNEFKESNLTKDERNSISDKMFKYIIGSCYNKMHRRAFHWASCVMIGSLTTVNWSSMPNFSSVPIGPDRRLAKFLSTTTSIEDIPGSGKKTFGQWAMTFHPSGNLDKLPSLDDFLTHASGPSNYQFDQHLAAIFHNLLLSSLYTYLCLIVQLTKNIKNVVDPQKISKEEEEKIQKYVGPFSNAIRILYLVSHSNAMKAYFSCVALPFNSPSHQGSEYYKNVVQKVIGTKIGRDIGSEAYVDEDGDPNPRENYVEDYKESDARSIYRRSIMSFVDHYAALNLLERRSLGLPANERIKLVLIAVRDPKTYYFPWEEMEKVIHKTCQDFTSTTSNPVEGQVIIDKIKEHLNRIEVYVNQAILSFKTLLKNHTEDKQLVDSQYPPFPASIHCESSLAAILCCLHSEFDNLLNRDDSKLHDLFQACPSSSSRSSLFTP